MTTASIVPRRARRDTELGCPEVRSIQRIPKQPPAPLRQIVKTFLRISLHWITARRSEGFLPPLPPSLEALS
jgi:hypothetical protein